MTLDIAFENLRKGTPYAYAMTATILLVKYGPQIASWFSSGLTGLAGSLVPIPVIEEFNKKFMGKDSWSCKLENSQKIYSCSSNGGKNNIFFEKADKKGCYTAFGEDGSSIVTVCCENFKKDGVTACAVEPINS